MTTERKVSNSIREQIRKAREAGHDTLGIVNDPETLGALEFVALTRELTDRLVDRFTRGHGQHTMDVAHAVWEPVAKCIVRAVMREMCGETALHHGGVARFGDPSIGRIAATAIESARPRLGDALRDDQVLAAARQASATFEDHEHFTFPTEFHVRSVPYLFHRDGDELIVRREAQVS